jgi:hypothetical protein
VPPEITGVKPVGPRHLSTRNSITEPSFYKIITMPANLWKSLTVRFMALGHSFHEAECIAAVIVIDCLVIYTIMGYRFRDAEREQPPVIYSGPETLPMILTGNCGIFPAVTGTAADSNRALLFTQ